MSSMPRPTARPGLARSLALLLLSTLLLLASASRDVRPMELSKAQRARKGRTASAAEAPRAAPATRGSEEDEKVPRSVALPLGRVLGSPCATDRTATAYRGIPFAQAPVGEARFRPPQPYATAYPALGLDATQMPAPCGSYCDAGIMDTTVSSEDCLFMNLWVPAKASLGLEKVPVRVYIHGGDLTECSASDPQWDGCQTASRANMIQVNIQWRMGPLGMLAHPLTMLESNTTGNWGLLDQQMALKWVKDHIAYFGGDPEQVLLHGHSRGAQMVDFHMVAPGSAGLFSSAVSQSAPCVHLRTLEQAYTDSKKFMTAIRCMPLESIEAELECMRNASWAYLMETTRAMESGRPLEILWCDRYDWTPTFQHAVDGSVLPYGVLAALERGNFHQVPYMTGFTTAEGGGFAGPFYADDVTISTIEEFISQIFPGADPLPILHLYSAELFKDSPDDILARYQALWTDTFFTCPIHERIVAREAQIQSAPTYVYWWGAGASCPPEWAYQGPIHGIDVWYTFAITSNFTSSQTASGRCNYNTTEVELSRVVMEGFRSLAATGTPKWPNQTSWVEWDNGQQLGTYLNAGEYTTKVLDFSKRCDTLLNAKQLSASQPHVQRTSRDVT